MAYRSLSLFPSVGNDLLADRFSRMDHLFSRLTGENPLSETPAYDLIQKNNDAYELTVSVPGYTEDELDISVTNNQLEISSKQDSDISETTEENNDIKWLHRGIPRRSFSLGFTLQSRIKVESANLNKGLLKLEFSYDIPEEQKPKKIPIQLAANTQNKSIKYERT